MTTHTRLGMRLRSALAAVGTSILIAVGLAIPADAAAAAGPERTAASSCSLEPGTNDLTVTSSGIERRALVYVPADVNPGPRLAVAFNLHGSGSNPEEQMARSGLAATAEEQGFIVTAPQGGVGGGTSWAWNVPHVTTAPGAPDDQAFINDLIDVLASTGCADPARMYATGYSGGGRMISQFACDYPGRFAAIAPVAGLRAGAPLASDPSQPDTTTCDPGTGVPVVTFHGTADIVNWYDGGGLFPYWGYSVGTALSRWAQINECRQVPTTTQLTEHVSATSYRACRANTDTVLYTVNGGGHTWPGSDPNLYPAALLPVTQEIDASTIMWDFFRTRHSQGRG